MPVGQPRQEVGGPVFIPGPDNQVNRGNSFFIMQVLFHHLHVNCTWGHFVVCDSGKDLLGGKHDLVSSPVGKGNIEVKTGIVAGCLSAASTASRRS